MNNSLIKENPVQTRLMGSQTLRTGSSVYKSTWLNQLGTWLSRPPFHQSFAVWLCSGLRHVWSSESNFLGFAGSQDVTQGGTALSTQCSQEDWPYLSVFRGDIYPLPRWIESSVLYSQLMQKNSSVATAWVRPKQTQLWSLQPLEMWFRGEPLSFSELWFSYL